MTDIRELLGKKLLFFDGGMGTMLQKNGMGAGEIPEPTVQSGREKNKRSFCSALRF